MEIERWLFASAYLLGVNLVGLILMYADKRRASRRRRRIPERVLLSLALVGGAAGLWAGMRWRRHKTKKPAFSLGLPLLSFAYAILFLWLTYRMLVGLA